MKAGDPVLQDGGVRREHNPVHKGGPLPARKVLPGSSVRGVALCSIQIIQGEAEDYVQRYSQLPGQPQRQGCRGLVQVLFVPK